MTSSSRATVESLLSAAISGLRGAAHTGVLIGEDHRLFGANQRALTMLGLPGLPTDGLDWVGITPPEYRTGDDQAINDAIKFGASRWFRKQFLTADETRVMIDLIVIATEITPFRFIALLREPNSSPLRGHESTLQLLTAYDTTDATFRLARRMAGAGTLRQVLTAIDRLAAGAIGCDYVNVATATEWSTLHIHHEPSAAPSIRDQYTEVARDATSLLGETFINDTASLLSIDEFATRYPMLGDDARVAGFTHLGAAPMHADDGRVVGVLGTAWRDGVDIADLGHVEAIADLLGNAVDLATDTERARSMAASFQEMLLPARLDAVNGAVVTVRYSVVDRAVGGDFYDVVTGADDTSWFVIGDVSGHGLPAARTMGKIRFFLRAVMRDESDPFEVLRRVHELLLTEDMDELATCMIGRWDPNARKLTLANAGHPPPIVTAGTTRTVSVTPNPPLGTPHVALTPQNTVVDIDGPMRLLLYTDGIIERRDQVIDESIGALVARVEMSAGVPLEHAADIIIDEATGSGDDDMALLLIDFSN